MFEVDDIINVRTISLHIWTQNH